MIKRTIANLSARLLRAAAGRVSTDLELTRTLQAALSSASLIDSLMSDAKTCASRIEVMKYAFDATVGDGFVCELGVYRGQSLNEVARWCSPTKVYGFDTFTGLPEFWRDGFPEGAFDVSSEELNFEKNCVLYKGLFDQTLPVFLQDVTEMARLIHVDCDLYSSTISALRVLAPRIRVGTVLVFDEYFNYPGWQNHEHKAFLEFLNETGLDCTYLAYNKTGQQVAAIISAKAK
jgi:hypothetical protein